MRALPSLALVLASAAALPAAGADPGDLDLEVHHTVVVVAADGVTRTTDFRERVHRRAELVWVERILPPALDAAAEPAGGERASGAKEHEHPEISAASRWITRESDGVRLRLVLGRERLVLEVPPADRATVGFDGDWETASRFIRASSLATMKRLRRAAPGGARWYEGRTPEGVTRVLWDERDRYPRRVETRNAPGTVVKTTVAARIGAPARPPWTRLEGYATKEYSDLLD